MKSNTSSKRGLMLSSLVAAMAVVGLSGCIFVPYEPGTVYEDNYAPTILDVEASCTYDYYSGYGHWEFWMTADDPDGYYDIMEAYVDVIDRYYNPGVVAESWGLTYLNNDTWGGSVEEYDSYVLSCDYYGDFDFDFWVVDSYGYSDVWYSVRAYPY